MSGSQHDKSIADLPGSLELDDFDYEMPPELIAQEPALERSSSRLMVLDKTERKIEHRQFSDLKDYLRKGDVLVLNNTKVIPARIIAKRPSGGEVEILLIKPEANRLGVWQAMANPLRKLKLKDKLTVETADSKKVEIIVAGFYLSVDFQRRVLVDFGGQAEVHKLLSKIGEAPLPPYILRERCEGKTVLQDGDMERYQTVYAKEPGAVAAPTAGLHFTDELIQQLKDKGVHVSYLTLHVGPGTFKPISSSIEEHSVEPETFQISEETARLVNEARSKGGRVIAVGTTSCRALETAGASGRLKPALNESSSLYLRPGCKFAIVDALITNFHLPKSSLLVLVSAFAGHDFVMSAYKEAVDSQYRFYSYGDAMFIH